MLGIADMFAFTIMVLNPVHSAAMWFLAVDHPNGEAYSGITKTTVLFCKCIWAVVR